MAVAARRDGVSVQEGWLGMPNVQDGADGVRFIEASYQSSTARGAWVSIK